MIINIIIVSLIVLLLLWGAYDLYRNTFNDTNRNTFNDTNQNRLDAIRSAEEFRRYAKSSGNKEAYNLTGQAIASLYKPEELSDE